MKVNIKGQFLNGKFYEGCLTKESVTQAEAEAIVSSYDVTTNLSTDNGVGLDFDTIELSIVDDFVYKDIKISFLERAISRYNQQMYAAYESVKAALTGETKIKISHVEIVPFENQLVGQICSSIGASLDDKKAIWKLAIDIQSESIL